MSVFLWFKFKPITLIDTMRGLSTGEIAAQRMAEENEQQHALDGGYDDDLDLDEDEILSEGGQIQHTESDDDDPTTLPRLHVGEPTPRQRVQASSLNNLEPLERARLKRLKVQRSQQAGGGKESMMNTTARRYIHVINVTLLFTRGVCYTIDASMNSTGVPQGLTGALGKGMHTCSLSNYSLVLTHYGTPRRDTAHQAVGQWACHEEDQKTAGERWYGPHVS